MNKEQLEKVSHGKGFIAALDQSGGSTPKALKEYGVNEDHTAMMTKCSNLYMICVHVLSLHLHLLQIKF